MPKPYTIFILFFICQAGGAVSDLNEISSILNPTISSKDSTENHGVDSSSTSQLEASPLVAPSDKNASAGTQGTLNQPFATSQRIPEEQRLYPPGYKRKIPYQGPLKTEDLPE